MTIFGLSLATVQDKDDKNTGTEFSKLPKMQFKKAMVTTIWTL